MTKEKDNTTKSTSLIKHYKHHYYSTGLVEKITHTPTATFKKVLSLPLLDAWKVVKNNILFIESVPASTRESTTDLENLLYPRLDLDEFLIFPHDFYVLTGNADRELKNIYYAQSANYLISAGLHQYYQINGIVHRITEQDPENKAYFNKVECKADELRHAFAEKLPLYATTVSKVLQSTYKIGSQYTLCAPDKDYPDVLFALFAANTMPTSCTPLCKDNGVELTDPYYAINLSKEAIYQFVNFCHDTAGIDFAIDLIGDCS